MVQLIASLVAWGATAAATVVFMTSAQNHSGPSRQVIINLLGTALGLLGLAVANRVRAYRKWKNSSPAG